MTLVTLSDGRQAAVAFFDSFTLTAGGNIGIEGTLPVILAVNGDMVINGSVGAGPEATSGWYAGGAPGPDSPNRAGICPLDTVAGGGGAGLVSGSGGGGGEFCGVGGAGGIESLDAGQAVGGVSYGTPELLPLVGGSSGGSQTTYCASNHGGGAIEIVSGSSIVVGPAGVINMGGGADCPDYSQSGGGSGGAILLEAPSVTVQGVLAANGGGYQGGAASDQPSGVNGSAGATANGGAGTYAPGVTIGGYGGTIGGGGGAGRIRVNTGSSGTLTVAESAVISPYASTGCYTTGTLQ